MLSNSKDISAITPEQMYKIEENGHNLLGMRRVYMMENAGHGIADIITAKFKKNLAGMKIVAVCGTGNNGGDCFVAVRHLASYFDSSYTVILLGHPYSLRSEESRINWDIIKKMNSVDVIDTEEVNGVIKERISSADIILDGIFGTGIKGEIRDPHASAIDIINESKAYKVAVDIPSGLNPTTGEANERCVRANITVTFHRIKTGLLNNKKYTGTIHIEHIGIPKEAELGVV
jgi:NAD(P)H-hydrate epimerase